MELWILLGLLLMVLSVAVVARLRHSRRRDAKQTKNIYPLW